MDSQEVPSDQQEQLDAVLDAALDELDDDQDAAVDTVQASPQEKQDATPLKDGTKAATSRPVAGPEPPPFDMGSFDDVMKQMFQGGEAGGDPEAALDSFMKQLQSQLASELGIPEPPESRECESEPSTAGKSAKASEKQGTPPPAKKSCQENNVDRTISKLLNDMATANNTQEDAEDITGEEAEMFQDMMKEFEKLGGGFDQDAVVDGMMQQLVSKDIMYEPMKQVTEKFPLWLEKNKDVLSEEEYKK
jgi:peroxin-19